MMVLTIENTNMLNTIVEKMIHEDDQSIREETKETVYHFDTDLFLMETDMILCSEMILNDKNKNEGILKELRFYKHHDESTHVIYNIEKNTLTDYSDLKDIQTIQL